MIILFLTDLLEKISEIMQVLKIIENKQPNFIFLLNFC